MSNAKHKNIYQYVELEKKGIEQRKKCSLSLSVCIFMCDGSSEKKDELENGERKRESEKNESREMGESKEKGAK
jgi:hypothetical protein